MNADPSTWGYSARDGPPWTGPEDEEVRGHGIETGEEGWKDTTSEEYKQELRADLESRRHSSFSDLPDWVWERLLAHVSAYSEAYWIPGAKPTVLKGYIVEWEEDPSSSLKPVISQPAKRSPVMEEVEATHVRYQQGIGSGFCKGVVFPGSDLAKLLLPST